MMASEISPLHVTFVTISFFSSLALSAPDLMEKKIRDVSCFCHPKRQHKFAVMQRQ